MVKRYVFKLFASVGPGGSFASLIEQVCTSVYPRAYTVGDDDDLETVADREIARLKKDFIDELFEVQEKFDEEYNNGEGDKE